MQDTLQPKNDEPLLTVGELAAYLKIAPVTVYRLTEARRIPVVRVGRKLRYRRRDVEHHLDAHVTEPRYVGPTA